MSCGKSKELFWRNVALNCELNKDWISIDKEIWVCNIFYIYLNLQIFLLKK